MSRKRLKRCLLCLVWKRIDCFQVIVIFFGRADQINVHEVIFWENVHIFGSVVVRWPRGSRCKNVWKKSKTLHKTQFRFRKYNTISQNILENMLFQKTFTKDDSISKRPPVHLVFSVMVLFFDPRGYRTMDNFHIISLIFLSLLFFWLMETYLYVYNNLKHDWNSYNTVWIIWVDFYCKLLAFILFQTVMYLCMPCFSSQDDMYSNSMCDQ